MKGLIFTEFMDMVEESWGLQQAEALIDKVNPPSGGIYTAVGNYPPEEMVAMVSALSEDINTPVPDLLVAFGERIFGLFTEKYGAFFAECSNSFEFLAGIHDHIHVEVRKLYPDAELPDFSYPDAEVDHMVMDYESTRPLAHFAYGLILSTVKHYGENIEVTMHDLSDGAGTRARFELHRHAA